MAPTMRRHLHSHLDRAPHAHLSEVSAAGETPRPTDPSRAVLVDVGEHRGALVLTAPAECEGLEVEIHPTSDPSQRTHVWVLPRAGRNATVYAAVFPSLPADDYAVAAPDGSTGMIVSVPPNQVTSAAWEQQQDGVARRQPRR